MINLEKAGNVFNNLCYIFRKTIQLHQMKKSPHLQAQPENTNWKEFNTNLDEIIKNLNIAHNPADIDEIDLDFVKHINQFLQEFSFGLDEPRLKQAIWHAATERTPTELNEILNKLMHRPAQPMILVWNSLKDKEITGENAFGRYVANPHDEKKTIISKILSFPNTRIINGIDFDQIPELFSEKNDQMISLNNEDNLASFYKKLLHIFSDRQVNDAVLEASNRLNDKHLSLDLFETVKPCLTKRYKSRNDEAIFRALYRDQVSMRSFVISHQTKNQIENVLKVDALALDWDGTLWRQLHENGQKEFDWELFEKAYQDAQTQNKGIFIWSHNTVKEIYKVLAKEGILDNPEYQISVAAKEVTQNALNVTTAVDDQPQLQTGVDTIYTPTEYKEL